MDFGDEDLFAVFDSESSKSKRSAIASETLDEGSAVNEQTERPVKFDAGVLTAEITPSKRAKSDDEEEPVKKIKRDDTRNMVFKYFWTKNNDCFYKLFSIVNSRMSNCFITENLSGKG